MSTEGKPPTKEATLTILLREGESNAKQLASLVGISVQAMRRHLRSLEDQGIVMASSIRRGPGRPSNFWQLTPLGHKAFQDSSEDFAIGLLASINRTLPPEEITRLLQKQATTKANLYRKKIGTGSIQSRLKKLIELRRLEGYLTESEPEPKKGGWIVNAFHCSIKKIAEEHPIVCDQELDMIRQALPDCIIERIQWRIEGGHSCGFHILPTTLSSK